MESSFEQSEFLFHLPEQFRFYAIFYQIDLWPSVKQFKNSQKGFPSFNCKADASSKKNINHQESGIEAEGITEQKSTMCLVCRC